MGRPGSLRRQHETDESFTRAAYDAIAEIEHLTPCSVQLRMFAMARLGVWYVELEALSTSQEGAGRSLARITGEYPNGRALTLSAYIFQQANSLLQMVEAAYGSEMAGREVRDT